MKRVYAPRGAMARVLESMRANPDRALTAPEMAELLGIQQKGVSAATAAARRAGVLFSWMVGTRAMYSVNDPTPPAVPQPFAAALWSDGDVVLVNPTVQEDGSVLLSAENVAMLRRLLGGAQ